MKNKYYMCAAFLLMHLAVAQDINWAKHDTSLLGKNVTETEVLSGPDVDESVEECENGWFKRQNTCYSYESLPQSYEDAKFECRKKKAKLLTINSRYEYERELGLPNLEFTWTGLNMNKNGVAEWSSQSKFDIEEMNWLLKPSTSAANGYSQDRKCAAEFGGILDSARYAYWFPCSQKFKYVCEKKLSSLHDIELFNYWAEFLGA